MKGGKNDLMLWFQLESKERDKDRELERLKVETKERESRREKAE